MATILVIDEDLATLDLACDTLRAAGHAVEVATSAREGLRRLAHDAFDAVILEVVLQDKEGIETIIEIRRRWPALTVLAMSGGGAWLGAADVLSLARSLGAHQVLYKPLFPEALLRRVAEANIPAAAPGGAIPN